jgi:hypothetical protein
MFRDDIDQWTLKSAIEAPTVPLWWSRRELAYIQSAVALKPTATAKLDLITLKV